MANDEGETLDFGEMGMLDDDMFAQEAAPGDPGATPVDTESPDDLAKDKEPEEKQGLLEKVRNASPFTVMLGLSLLAIIVAVVFLSLELNLYNWDFTAKEFKAG